MEARILSPGTSVKVVGNRYGTNVYLMGKCFVIKSSSIIAGSNALTNDYYYADDRGRQVVLYHGDVEKGWQNREEEIAFLKAEILMEKKTIKNYEDRIGYLQKYKDEEEALAYKIYEIMQNKNDVKAIAELLRKNKSDLL